MDQLKDSPDTRKSDNLSKLNEVGIDMLRNKTYLTKPTGLSRDDDEKSRKTENKSEDYSSKSLRENAIEVTTTRNSLSDSCINRSRDDINIQAGQIRFEDGETVLVENARAEDNIQNNLKNKLETAISRKDLNNSDINASFGSPNDMCASQMCTRDVQEQKDEIGNIRIKLNQDNNNSSEMGGSQVYMSRSMFNNSDVDIIIGDNGNSEPSSLCRYNYKEKNRKTWKKFKTKKQQENQASLFVCPDDRASDSHIHDNETRMDGRPRNCTGDDKMVDISKCSSFVSSMDRSEIWILFTLLHKNFWIFIILERAWYFFELFVFHLITVVLNIYGTSKKTTVKSLQNLKNNLRFVKVHKRLFRSSLVNKEIGFRQPLMKSECLKLCSPSGLHCSDLSSFSKFIHSDIRDVSSVFPCFRDHSSEENIHLASLETVLNNINDLRSDVIYINLALTPQRDQDPRNINYLPVLTTIHDQSPRHVMTLELRYFFDYRFQTPCLCLTEQSINRIVQETFLRHHYHTRLLRRTVNCDRRYLQVFIDCRYLAYSAHLTANSIYCRYREDLFRFRFRRYIERETNSRNHSQLPQETIENQREILNRHNELQVLRRNTQYTTCMLGSTSTIFNHEVDHRYNRPCLRFTNESYRLLQTRMSQSELESSGLNIQQFGFQTRTEILNCESESFDEGTSIISFRNQRRFFHTHLREPICVSHPENCLKAFVDGRFDVPSLSLTAESIRKIYQEESNANFDWSLHRNLGIDTDIQQIDTHGETKTDPNVHNLDITSNPYNKEDCSIPMQDTFDERNREERNRATEGRNNRRTDTKMPSTMKGEKSVVDVIYRDRKITTTEIKESCQMQDILRKINNIISRYLKRKTSFYWVYRSEHGIFIQEDDYKKEVERTDNGS